MKISHELKYRSVFANDMFAICLLACGIGIFVMTQKEVTSDAIIGTWTVIWILLGVYFLYWLKIASQWEKAVVLRLGKFHRLAGPGGFWLVPFVDTLSNWIDHRVMVTPFNAEKALWMEFVLEGLFHGGALGREDSARGLVYSDLLANLIWSAKESVLKARRVGLRADTRTVEVRLAGDRFGGRCGLLTLRCVEPVETLRGCWWVADGFVYTIASSEALCEHGPAAEAAHEAAAEEGAGLPVLEVTS